ncbi:MAG: heparan-alpha-glucosaminide N-acetyltransferase domain-containing protein [Bacteroidota bacterium]
MPEQQLRLPWIDTLRGIAIILMVPANLAPYLSEPHSMLYRILGSFAAPTFIMLSAGMVVLRGEKHNFAYYLKRAGIVIGVGILLDTVLWRIFPFTSFDVLYTIGLAMPLLYLLRRSDHRELLYLSIILIIGTYVMQALFGYNEVPLEVYFDDLWTPTFGRLMQSWFIDGWFPIFPWLGYAFIGALFFRTLFAEGTGTSHHFITLGAGLTIIGFVLLFAPIPFIRSIADGTILATRSGYSEIFYPPTFAYIFTSIGIVVLSSTLLRRMDFNPAHSILGFFGRHSMMVYILHQVFGSIVLQPIIESYGVESIDSGPLFTLVNLVMLLLIAAICYGIEMLKHRYPPRSTVLQVLIGR